MTIEVRPVALAIVVLLLQSCQPADADHIYAVPNEARLKQVIKESIKPKPAAHTPLPANVDALLAWSKPVNGLVARVEHDYFADIFFVRLKNVSDRPLIVPTGNPADEKTAPLFEVYAQQGSSPWRSITGATRYGRYFTQPDADQNERVAARPEGSVGQRQPSDRPRVTLESGQDCIALATGSDPEGSGEPKRIKVVVRRPDASDAQRWSGVLETLPRPLVLPLEERLALRGVVQCPDYLPPLSYDYSGFVAMSGRESSVWLLYHNNLPVIDLLSIYAPVNVGKEFERRMQAEENRPMKLLLATVAAPAGSEKAALYFLEAIKGTDYLIWKDVHDALQFTCWNYRADHKQSEKREPPAWLAELLLAVCSDERSVTGLEKTNFAEGTSFTISKEFGMLATLVAWKFRGVVPLLDERIKNGKADVGAWCVLAEFGDRRAVPALIELLVRIGKKNPLPRDETLRDDFRRCASTLAKLKAHDAVPALLTYAEYPEIIGDLDEIGDERAIPTLKKIVADNGRILRDGQSVHSKFESERLFAAKLALAHFDPPNEAVHLESMLNDPNEFHRHDVFYRLERLPDPRVIPILVKVVKTDSDHWMISMSINDLGRRKYKAAVEGLIECFDRQFKEEYFGKGEHVAPATYPNLIASSLQQITGQSYGADKQQWLKWWQKERRSTNLK
jgi:HEAT repeat protein